MKLDPDQYDFSNKLKRVKVKDPVVAKALARIAAGEQHVVLRTEDGTEVVAMSLEEYESISATLEVEEDPELREALRESLAEAKEGRYLTHEEVFGHPLRDAPTDG